jgi:hypothetical protein
MILKRIARFLTQPERSVIDDQLYNALRLCIKASDEGLVTIVSPEESSARLGHAIAALRGELKSPGQEAYRAYEAEA